jgi:N12 class adenine-specific DNA methylase
MNATHPGYNKEIKCNSIRKRSKDHVFTPAPHQSKVKSFFKNSLYKGLLLYHKLGSGKSCTSIMVADDFLKNNLVKHVYVLTPGSLRKNWISEYCRVCGRIDKTEIMKKFTFITNKRFFKIMFSEFFFFSTYFAF